MKKILYYLLIITIVSLQLNFIFPIATLAVKKLNYKKQMDMKIVISPRKLEHEGSQTVIYAGESFTLDVTVTNNTFMEEYGPDDIRLTSPHAAVDFGECGNYISPSMTRWELYLGSMENTPTKTFNKTFITDSDFPLKKCTPEAFTWTDKDDPDTLDKESQIYPPIKVLPAEEADGDGDGGGGDGDGDDYDNSNDDDDSDIDDVNQDSSDDTGSQDSDGKNQEDGEQDGNESLVTSIDGMTRDQLREVKNFTIEIENKNKVQFKNTFDFSQREVFKKLQDISAYVNFSNTGEVTIDSKSLDMLKGEAIVTMYNLPYKVTPTIYKNGRLAKQSEVSNVTYIYSEDTESGTLIFQVSGFSTYTAKLEEMISKTTSWEIENPLLRALILIGIITVQGMIAAFLVKVITGKKSKYIR
jgi:hypothetical protein